MGERVVGRGRTRYPTRYERTAAGHSGTGRFATADHRDGAAQSPQTVHAHFQAAFATIDEVVHRAGLSERCRKKISKARALVPKLVATLAFFHGELERTLTELGLAPAAERFFGQTPYDLFDWLLLRLDVPAQPRAKRLRLAI